MRRVRRGRWDTGAPGRRRGPLPLDRLPGDPLSDLGLDGVDADARRRRFGPNEIPEVVPGRWRALARVTTVVSTLVLVQAPALASRLHLAPLHADDWLLATGAADLAAAPLVAGPARREHAGSRRREP